MVLIAIVIIIVVKHVSNGTNINSNNSDVMLRSSRLIRNLSNCEREA